jgi:hypothetical protein
MPKAEFGRGLKGVLLAAMLLSACDDDLSPVSFDAGDDGNSVVDVSVSPDAPSCVTCVQDTCPAAWEACQANQRCKAMTQCVDFSNCWAQQLVNLSNIPACLVDCAVSAGIMVQTDPANGLLVPVFNCANTASQCGTVCANLAPPEP